MSRSRSSSSILFVAAVAAGPSACGPAGPEEPTAPEPVASLEQAYRGQQGTRLDAALERLDAFYGGARDRTGMPLNGLILDRAELVATRADGAVLRGTAVRGITLRASGSPSRLLRI